MFIRGLRAIRQRHCSAVRGKSQHGHVVARPLWAGGPESLMGGGTGAWSQTDLRSGEDPGNRRCHAAYQAQGNGPVELPADGGPSGSQ
jgi:hypothetical protein